jgi:hypothetical protein
VNLSDLLNGVGPFVAISALPMLAGLFIREGQLAHNLRRFAIFLAVALPIIFMVLVGLFYLQQSGDVFFDFKVNYDAAKVLYGQNGDPYSVHAAYSFPFPTFHLYWITSLFGQLSQPAAWVVWWIVNLVVWAICAILLWRTLPRSASPRGRDMMLYAAVAIPAMATLWQGQTALFALAGLVSLHLATLSESRWTWIIGGVGLAIATLIKPQIALVGLGIVIWLAWRKNDREFLKRSLWIAGSAIIAALALIGITLILPGGVSLDTYQRFISEALPQIARPGDAIWVIGSPSFVASWLALQFGLPSPTVDLVGTMVTMLMIVAGIIWTIKRRDRGLVEIAAGWAVWAMIALRVTWTWYAAWCLPFFLLTVNETANNRQTRRLGIIVVILALLNLQVSILPVAFLTILLLIGILWTSFKPTKP